MGIEQQKKEIVYESVDCDGLCKCLAESDWKIQTEHEHVDALWQINTLQDPITGDIEIIKEIVPHWATLYWNLYEQYRVLVNQFLQERENI